MQALLVANNHIADSVINSSFFECGDSVGRVTTALGKKYGFLAWYAKKLKSMVCIEAESLQIHMNYKK